jgi:hypothetical protein
MDHVNDRRRDDLLDIVRAGGEYSDGEDDADEWQHGDRNDDHEDSDDDEQNNDDDDIDDDAAYVRGYAARCEIITRQILRNDPSLHTIFIGRGTGEYIPYVYGTEWPPSVDECDWDEFGTQIGSHTHLKDMHITFSGATSAWRPFFRGLALNRSIKSLSLFGVGDEQFLKWLIPFFVHNPVFESLFINHRGGAGLGELIHAIEQFKSLKEFKISSCTANVTDFTCNDKLITALAGHTDLRKLDFSPDPSYGWGEIFDRKGLSAITMLLQNPLSKLAVLNLKKTGIDDEGARILSSGLNENSSLRELNLGANEKITAVGWCVIFSSINCKLEKLLLSSNCIDGSAALSLKSVLIANCTVNAVELNSMDRQDDLVRIILEIIRSPSCALESLSLNSTSMNVGDVQSLSEALAVNDRLRVLGLCHQGRITPEEWRYMFHYLQRPTCMLEELILGGNHINDDIITSLTNILSYKNRLRILDLSEIRGVTTTGWMNFSEVFRSPNIMLERLVLVECANVNNRVIASIANALSDNKTLKELYVGYGDHIQILHAILIAILCNTSSILSTYDSNHTLEECTGIDEFDLPSEDLTSLLKINKENSNSQAARIKIIKTHFSGSKIKTQAFTSMEIGVLPAAIAWMGRDDESSEIMIGSGINILFSFLKSTPLVCESKSNCKKRKAAA